MTQTSKYVISNITHKGFDLVSKQASVYHKWNEFKSIAFDKKKRKVICKKGLFQQIVLTDFYQGWHCFLKKVPTRFTDFDFEYVKLFFASLLPCKTCGNIAVHQGNCCACGSEAWNTALAEDYDTEREYIKEEQLDYFATHDESDFFDGFYQHHPCFVFDNTWAPLITDHERIEFCEEHYWA